MNLVVRKHFECLNRVKKRYISTSPFTIIVGVAEICGKCLLFSSDYICAKFDGVFRVFKTYSITNMYGVE